PHHRALLSFPTRRSSDLNAFVVGVRDNFEGRPLGELDLYSSPVARALRGGINAVLEAGLTFDICVRSAQLPELINLLTSIVEVRDRKSTRLNSSHVSISY